MNLNVLPKELIYTNIIPYCPFVNMTNHLLQLQKRRLVVFHFIQKKLLIENESEIKQYVFDVYQGESSFCFENDHYFILIEFNENNKIDNFLCICF